MTDEEARERGLEACRGAAIALLILGLLLLSIIGLVLALAWIY